MGLLLNTRGKLKILFVTTEEAPFAKVGGLGEVMFALPRALKELGHDARVLIPRYGTIAREHHKLSLAYEGLEVPAGSAPDAMRLSCNILRYDPNGGAREPVTTYFLENQEYYELRSNIYGYIDDHIRFALLSRGALEFLNLTREWMPDVVVATDWMTGFLPNFLRVDYASYQRLRDIAAVFSIHNLSSQGPLVSHRFGSELERDDGQGPLPDLFSPRISRINCMRRGIIHSDAINTVSPTYANEIMTPEFGEGLDGVLRERRSRLYGILNGIDYETNDPSGDPALAVPYDSRTLERRSANKAALQQRFGLPQNDKAFVMGIVSRMSRQKGLELLKQIMVPFLRASGAQLMVVGTGDTAIMEYFQDLHATLPAQVGVHLQYDNVLPHLVFGGSDVILVPSQFEPSGLTQMEAMRFGALPVARRIGGLADTIDDYSPNSGGTGFLFDEFDAHAFLMALTRARTIWRHTELWRQAQKRAMQTDFSWRRSAMSYIDYFEKAIALHKADRDTVEAAGAPTALLHEPQ